MTAKSEYKISNGVTWVNGANIAGQKTIKLTETEASYDLALGRIAVMEKAEPVGKVKSQPNKAQDTAK